MTSFYNHNNECSSNGSSRSGRRTFSSPYLSSLHNNRGHRHHQQRSRFTSHQPRDRHVADNIRSNNDVRTGNLPRGSRTAPPFLYTLQPDVHEYYQRRDQVRKQVEKTLLQSKLDRLLECQKKLEKEIKDIEEGCGDMGIHSMPRHDGQNRCEAASTSGTSTKPRLKQFRVVGGCRDNLSYKVQRKQDKDGKVRSFSIQVDVKGYANDQIEVDTEDAVMSIIARKTTGAKKHLKVVAPSTKDMERAYVRHPRLGVLVIDF